MTILSLLKYRKQAQLNSLILGISKLIYNNLSSDENLLKFFSYYKIYDYDLNYLLSCYKSVLPKLTKRDIVNGQETNDLWNCKNSFLKPKAEFIISEFQAVGYKTYTSKG